MNQRGADEKSDGASQQYRPGIASSHHRGRGLTNGAAPLCALPRDKQCAEHEECAAQGHKRAGPQARDHERITLELLVRTEKL